MLEEAQPETTMTPDAGTGVEQPDGSTHKIAFTDLEKTNVACGSPKFKGDGHCDDDNNNLGCDYDGGDCCGKVSKKYCKVCQCLDLTLRPQLFLASLPLKRLPVAWGLLMCLRSCASRDFTRNARVVFWLMMLDSERRQQF